VTGGITLFPGSPALIQAIYMESPLCPSGTGPFMTKKIYDVVDKWIEKSQYQGSVGDGVYGQCSVPDLLDRHFGRKGIAVWDGMHVAATVGRAMRETKTKHHEAIFSWLNTLSDTMAKGNNYINFGASWHELNEVFKRRQADHTFDQKALKTPKFNSDTHFENLIYLQYSEFRERYALLLEVLEATKEEFRNGGSTEKKKAETADQIQGRMYNTKFALSLSGMCAVYRCYSVGIKTLQIVNILPTVKYRKFKSSTVDKYKVMQETVRIADCPCSLFRDLENSYEKVEREEERGVVEEVCLWPSLHADIEELMVRGTYRTVPMGQLVEDTNRTREGNSQRLENNLLDREEIQEVGFLVIKLHIL
jgi:hypothetical protein